MKMERTSAVVEFRLANRFDSLRKRLHDPELSDRLEKPLAFWAFPDDRRLPLAFLDRKLGELLDTPFEDLYATPGIGRKKIASLVKLLGRAAREDEMEPDPAIFDVAETEHHELDAEGHFNAAAVSEAIWVHWRQCVREHGLQDEPLGRYAPSLTHLPRVLWRTPLGAYTDLTLAEIRALKTHGEKRVAAVLEVFSAVYKIMGRVSSHDHLDVRIVPSCIRQLQDWVHDSLHRDHVPSEDELAERFLKPALEQVRIDLGEQIAELAAGRVGLNDNEATVRQAAGKLGLTRARVYQLLADVGQAFAVRWPDGPQAVADLHSQMVANAPIRTQFLRFETGADLFFTGWRSMQTHVLLPTPPFRPTNTPSPHRAAG
jgi:hypothetical protein